MCCVKARITTLLSLTGVLVAGSAAALVNTQVLQSTSPKKSTATEITVVDSQSPGSPSSSAVPNKFDQLAPVVLAPAVTNQSFQVGEAGVVVLGTVGGVLKVVAVTPAAGWVLASAESSDPLHVEVKLQSATTLLQFKAALAGSTITPSVESSDIAPTTTGKVFVPGNGGAPVTVDSHHENEPGDDNGGTKGGKSGGGSDD